MKNEAPHENYEVPLSSPETSFIDVAERADKLLGALDETLSVYSEVTLPSGEVIPARGNHEFLVAKAQRLLEGVQGLREQVQAEGGQHHEERAAALLEAGITHMTEFLSVRADLLNEAHKNEGAAQLAKVLDQIAFALLPVEAKNDGSYDIDQKVA